MGTRAHRIDWATDPEGNALAGASVYIYDQGTEDPISETIYQFDSDGATPAATLSNPLTTGNDGKYEYFLEDSLRVTEKITKTNYSDQTFVTDVLRAPNNARHAIVDESTALTDRGTLRFTGAGVTAADDVANGRTNVTIAGGVTDHGALDGLADDDHPQYARLAAAQTFTEDQTIEAGNKIIMGTPYFMSGANTPEGAQTAPVGSLFLRNNGSSGTTLYVKESGSGNTGWRAMSSGARLLGGAGSGAGRYDPSTAATASTTALLAMTALDTTNLRSAITAPASGKVRVYGRVAILLANAGSAPGIIFGVLDGSTVRLRVTPHMPIVAAVGGRIIGLEMEGIISGLTPGDAYNLDLAYGVELASPSTNLGWGGPNNTTQNDAYGAAIFEVWEVVA